MQTTRILALVLSTLVCLVGRDAGAATLITVTSMGAAPTAWTNAIWKTTPTDSVSNAPAPGNTYVAISNGIPQTGNVNNTRLRNPAVDGTINFPGDSLTLTTNTDFRFKKGAAAGPPFPFLSPTVTRFPGVGGNPGLILDGGSLNPGDDATFPIAGSIRVLSDSLFGMGDGNVQAVNINRGFQVQASLTGSGSLIIVNAATNFANVEVTSANNDTYTGSWIVKAGWLKGTAAGSLGKGNITLDPSYSVSTTLVAPAGQASLTNGPIRFEVNYDIDSPGTLTVASGDAQFVLHQNCRFAKVFVDGNPIPNGTYPYAFVAANFPNHVVPGGSGSISVGPATPGGLTVLPGDSQNVLSWTGSPGATGYVIYQSLASGLSTNGTSIFTNGIGTSYTNSGLVNGTQYFYVVSAINAGGESTNSVEASGTPGQFAPAIAVDVVGSTNCTGTTASFSVGVTNTFPVAYQWYYNGTILLPNQTNSTYTTNNVQVANSGTYSVVITNSFGSVTSSLATLLVKVTTIATGPANQTNCPGSPVLFTTVASGAGTLTYTWRKGASVIQGPDGNNTYSIGSVSAGDSGQYSVTVVGDCNTVSNSFTFVVAPAPIITVQPQNQTTPMGNGAVFSVTALTTNAGAAPLSYQWKTNGVSVPGATASTFAISNLTLAANGMQVSVGVTNCAGGLLSSSAALTVTVISAISFDFNTPGQYSNAPYNLANNDWIANTLTSRQPFPPTLLFERPTGGVGGTNILQGGGNLDLHYNQGDETDNILFPLTYDFSLPGKSLTVSAMVKVKVPTAANRALQMGFITSTNVGNAVVTMGTPSGVGYMTAMFQSRVINVVNPSYQIISIEKPAAGTSATADFTPINSPTNTLTTNRWYKFSAKFTSMLGTPVFSVTNFTIDASVVDMGDNGITPGATVLGLTGFAQTNIDMITNKLYFILRNFENAGVDYMDNIYITTASGNVAFVQPLANQTVAQGQNASFQALVDGDGPYTYQWYKNGVAIPGAGNWKYRTPALRFPADNGAQFSVTVTSTNNSISSTSTVTVTSADLALLSVGSVDGGVIGLRFSQPVDLTTAQNPANYTISHSGGTAAAVGAQVVMNDGFQQYRTNEVLITPAGPISGSFTVVVANVQSSSATVIGAGNTAVGSVLGLTGNDVDPRAAGFLYQTPTLPGSEYSFAPGQITVNAGGHDIFGTFDGFRFTYKKITGDFDLKVHIPYQDLVRTAQKAGFDARVSLDPASPHVGAFADPMLPGRNFIEGVLRTNYFRESVSWGNQPALVYPNVWLRFRRSGHTFFRYSGTNGVNWTLDGQIESRGVEFPDTLYVGLANNCNVGVTTLQMNKLSQMDNYGDFAGYPGAVITITTQPSNVTTSAPNAALITAAATVTGGGIPAGGEMAFIWQRTNTAAGGWTNVINAGGTNAVLNTGGLRFTDSGAQYRVIIRAPGALSVTSAVATVTVTDTTAASVVSSFAAPLSPNQLVLTFNEYLNAATALNAANYLVTNGLGVQVIPISVTFNGSDPTKVVLTFADPLPGGTNFVRLVGVTDLNGNALNTLVNIVQTAMALPGLTAYQAQGPVVMEWWDGLISASGLRDLVNDVRYRRNMNTNEVFNGPNGSFDFIEYSNVFGIHPTAALPSSGWGENYGVKMYSYFRPPTTAAYRFFLRGDDYAEFWMNTNAANTTLPADVVIGTGTAQTNSPVLQNAWKAMDGIYTNNPNSKYLVGSAGNANGPNSGLYVIPAIGNTTVGGIRFWAGGDAVQRDPMTFTLAGSVNAGTNGPWVTIASGATGLSDITNYPGTGRYFPTNVMFTNLAGANTNSVAYRSYQLIFPTVRNQPTAENFMQIGEIQFLDAAGTKIVPSGATLLAELTAANANYASAASSSNSEVQVGITLNAGQLYYIETRFHEGGGGDGATVALRTDALIPAASEVISNNFLVFPTNRAPLTPVQWEQYSGVATLNPLVNQGGWNASGAGSIMDLIQATNLTNFIARVPNIVGYCQYFGWNSNRFQSGGTMDSYLSRIYAYFVPPTSGNYRFFMQVDDTAQFLMNTNAVNSTDPAGARVLGQIINYGGTAGANQNVGNGILNLQGGSGVYNAVVTNVNLVAGQRYYMEGRWREGTGGDGLNVAVRLPGDSTTPGLAETIPLSMLEFATNATVLRYGPIGLQGILTTTNGVPTGLNPVVREGDVLNFQAVGLYGQGSWQGSLANASISANSGQSETNTLASMGFVWLRNGTDLAKNQLFSGQMYYRSQPVTFADNGATISLLVSNTFSMATQTVTLTVIQDLTAPTILSANGSQYGDTVTIVFNEPVDAQTAQQLANYSIPGLSLYWVKRDDVDRRRVVLGTSRHTPLTVYTVTANGIRDMSQAGNATVNATKSFTGWGTGGIGGVYVEIFTNMNGSLDQFLQTSPGYIYNLPDVTYYTNNFAFSSTSFAVDTGLNFFGVRVTGLFMPPSNGVYRFFVRGDDNTQLYINTNGPDPRGAVLVAQNNGANSGALNGLSGYQTGPGLGGDTTLNNISSMTPPIAMTNGTAYWVEALMKEGTGGDYMEVVMRPLDGSGNEIGGVPAAGAGNSLGGGFFSAPGNPDLIQFVVNSAPPAELTVNELDPVSLTLNATAIPASLAPFVSYQWQRSNSVTALFTNIPGKTAPTLAFFAPLDADGATFRLVAQLPGTTLKLDTLLHVVQTFDPPVLLSVSSLDGNRIGARFNVPVDLGTAGEEGNWQINGGAITVLEATVRTNVDPRTVELLLQFPVTGDFTVDALSIGSQAATLNIGDSYGVVGGVQGFTALDVGGPLQAGSSFTSTNGEISVVAGGADIWGTADQGHITVGQRSGNFDVWTRVDSLIPRSASPDIAKAGLVVRDGTNADAKTLTVLLNPPASLGGRDLVEAGARTNIVPGVTAPTGVWPLSANVTPAGIPNAWVRLKRDGFIFRAMYSSNGVDWVTFATNFVDFPRTVTLGLGTTAHNNTSLPTVAEYKNLHIPNPPSITTQPSPASQSVAFHGSTSYTVAANNPANSGSLVYTWRRDGVVVGTGATLSIPDARGVDAGSYQVEVGNDGGSVLSDVVTLSVNNGLPTIGSDSLNATQNTARVVSAASLIANDSDPEGSNLVFSTVSGSLPVTVGTNFSQGNLVGSTLFGSAAVSTNGYLLLHNPQINLTGSLILDDLTPGKKVNGFRASFKLRISEGTLEPADGFSFNFAPDLPIGATTPLAAENGGGNGFSFCLDNYRFLPFVGVGSPAGSGASTTPNTSGMKMNFGGIVVAGVQTPTWNRPDFVPVTIDVVNSAVTVFVDGTNVFGTVALPSMSSTGRFGIYSRNGGQYQAAMLDDLNITVYTATTPGGGTVTSSGGNVTYSNSACSGSDSFYYIVGDGEVGGNVTAPVSVTLTEANPQAPLITTCATNRTYTLYTNSQIALPNLTGEIVATDSCGTPVVTQSPVAGTLLVEGPNVVTFTATDAGGSNSTCQITITVVVVKPQIIASSLSFGGTSFSGSFQTANGVNYAVEYKNDLSAPTWTLLTTIVGDGTVKTFTDPGPLPPVRFYQVRPTP